MPLRWDVGVEAALFPAVCTFPTRRSSSECGAHLPGLAREVNCLAACSSSGGRAGLFLDEGVARSHAQAVTCVHGSDTGGGGTRREQWGVRSQPRHRAGPSCPHRLPVLSQFCA